MFFVVRHGERADFSFDPKEKSKIMKEHDPPLTNYGLKQALITGSYIKTSLNSINCSSKTPIIITSPFLRCIETAINISKGFNSIYKNSIFIEDSIGEYLQRTWFAYNVYDDLTIKEETKKECEFQFLDGFLEKNESRKIKPEYPEDFLPFFKRIQKAFLMISEKFFREFDENDYFLVIVTHGYAVQVVLKNYGALQKLQTTEYCSVTLLKYYKDGNYDTLIKATDSHLTTKL